MTSRAVPEQFVADCDTWWRWEAMAGSGERAVVKMVHVWTMEGGKAVASQQHVDGVRLRELS